jgi:hypothetical protein
VLLRVGNTPSRWAWAMAWGADIEAPCSLETRGDGREARSFERRSATEGDIGTSSDVRSDGLGVVATVGDEGIEAPDEAIEKVGDACS